MMSVLPAMSGSRMAIDVDRDLTPVINLAGSAMAVVARSDAPFDDIDGLIAHARSKPGGLTYASSGSGILGEMQFFSCARNAQMTGTCLESARSSMGGSVRRIVTVEGKFLST